MKARWQTLFILALFVTAAFLFLPFPAHADCTQGDLNCDSCISGTQFNDPNLASNVIHGIFNTVNAVLGVVTYKFYTDIITNADYVMTISAAVTMYVVVYGAMIMFNLVEVSPYNIAMRLIKVAIVYAILGGYQSGGSNGFGFFYQWVGGPLVEEMNQLIGLFSQIGTGVNIQPIQAGGILDFNAVQGFIAPMTAAISIKYITAIMALISEGGQAMLVGFVLGWALLDFFLMLVGAIATYMKAIIGLAFLFGVAPVFFVFLLFEKTRNAFLGWLNQVISYALHPVILFAYLFFYVSLINTVLTNIMGQGSADYCFVKWFSMPGGLWDLFWWRGTQNGQAQGGDHFGRASEVSVVDALTLLVLSHLGYHFCEYISQLARDLTGGDGPGFVTGESISKWFNGNLMGGRNATQTAGAAASGAQSMVAPRRPPVTGTQ